jgi:hypothetical protein
MSEGTTRALHVSLSRNVCIIGTKSKNFFSVLFVPEGLTSDAGPPETALREGDVRASGKSGPKAVNVKAIIKGGRMVNTTLRLISEMMNARVLGIHQPYCCRQSRCEFCTYDRMICSLGDGL